jgi:dipeptidyl-peptidase III
VFGSSVDDAKADALAAGVAESEWD